MALDDREAVAVLERISLVREDRNILSEVTLTIRPGQRWVVLGRNGSGKTSLARVLAWQLHPSSGTVRLGDDQLGACDARATRRRIGFVSAAFADSLRRDLSARDIVMCALHGALEPWWHTYGAVDRDAAERCLDASGLGWAPDRTFGSLSSGERQRVLLARALMTNPDLLILDEPCAGLDLVGREQLIDQIDGLDPGDPSHPPVVLVTHHLEEIPRTATHVLLLRDGEVVTSGPIVEHLNSATLTECLGIEIHVQHQDQRWSARAQRTSATTDPISESPQSVG